MWVLICTMRLTVCSYQSCHVRASEWIHTLWLLECQGTPCSKQARNLKFTWLQLDSNPPLILQTKIQPFSQTGYMHFFKWLSCVVSTYLYGAFDCIFLSCYVRVSTLYGCLNVKKILARSRREIWSLSDCNWTRTHNHLIRKGTLNHLVSLNK